MMMSIAEIFRFEDMQRMASQWPTVCRRVRALEEALGLPEPPCKRHIREPRRGAIPGMSLPEFDAMENLRELNSEWDWLKGRVAAIEAALNKSDGVVRLPQRRRGHAA